MSSRGSVQSLSRSYFAKIIPQDRSGEYFGIYDIFGKGASFTGTLLVGLVTQLSGSQNIGVGVLSVMFPIGLIFFLLSVHTPD
ncbi:MAG: MFS transporter [Clostridiales bacterium]|nr:MFS transporter [Clostridiales bacterium]